MSGLEKHKNIKITIRLLRIIFALFIIGFFIWLPLTLAPTITEGYNAVKDSPSSENFSIPMYLNLNSTNRFSTKDMGFLLNFTYPHGTLFANENVTLEATLVFLNDNLYKTINYTTLGFQNCLSSPIGLDNNGLPIGAELFFETPFHVPESSTLTITGILVASVDSAVITWPIDGDYKPIIGVFYNDGTNSTYTTDDVIMHVYPQEQLTQIISTKVNMELTIAFLIFAVPSGLLLAKEVWPKSSQEPTTLNIKRLMRRN